MGEQEKEEKENIEIESPDKDLQGQEEIKRLNICLEQKTKEAETNFDKFLRACADLENYKKRAEKEKSELISFANERFIKEVLPVVDNLERAIGYIEAEAGIAAVKDGIKLVLDNLLVVLKKFGVEAASAMGEKFDPARHEAVSHEETVISDPGTVIKEFHKGYYLNGRLLRPAMVAIAKAPEKLAEEDTVQ